MATYSSYKQITTVNIPDGGVTGADLEVNIALPGTDSVVVPKGTEAQRGTGVAGKFRYNTDLNKFEGNNGTAWGTVGGGATGGGGDEIFIENGQTITEDYTITTNKNAMSTGPITIDTGITVTVPTGSRWVVL
tara:strand:+ start:4703 stop:5101 length:399 start_codon:yes stop_codon:yes gene_type:complete